MRWSVWMTMAMPGLALASAIGGMPFDLDTVEGRPTVVDAGHVRLQGLDLELDGIRALAPDAMCQADRPWRCGEYARDLLASYLDGHEIRCRLVSRPLSRNESRWRARCRLGRRDLQAFLVSRGLAEPEGDGRVRYGFLAERSRERGGAIYRQIAPATEEGAP